MEAPELSLRERKRRAVRDDLTIAAIGLFIKQGFDATTVDQVAASVGMSERTFFRYFSTKDDMLEHVSAHWRERVAAALAARPADEPVWTALRRGFDEYIETTSAEGSARALMMVIYNSPALHARHMLRMRRWHETLEPVVLARMGEPAPRFDVTIVVASAVACFEAARETWTRELDARSLAELLDAAMLAVTPAPTPTLQPA